MKMENSILVNFLQIKTIKIHVSNKENIKNSLKEVTNFAKGGNFTASLCKISYFPLLHQSEKIINLDLITNFFCSIFQNVSCIHIYICWKGYERTKYTSVIN